MKKWIRGLALLLMMLLCVPAATGETYPNAALAEIWWGESILQAYAERDSYFTRCSGVEYRKAFGGGEVDIGMEMASTIRRKGCNDVGDLVYELLIAESFYPHSTTLAIKTALIDSEIYCWESDGTVAFSDEYYLFSFQYLNGGSRLVLVNMYSESEGGESMELRTIETSYFEEPDWSRMSYIGDLVVRSDKNAPLLKEGPNMIETPRAAVPCGTYLSNCYAAANDYVYCIYEGMEGYLPMDYLREATAADVEDPYGYYDFGDYDDYDYGDYSSASERTLLPYEVHPFATSELSDKYGKYPADNAYDGDLKTTWAEGVYDEGVDETLGFYFDSDYYVTGITIWGGFQKDSRRYYKNNRPKQIAVWAGGEYQGNYFLDDAMTAQRIDFIDPVYADSVEIAIVTVYYGNECDDTCISEVDIHVLD